MAVLDWQLRQILPEFRESGRLNVLIALVLHANIRNRAWASLDTLAFETGFAVPTVNEAKKWLIEHGAIKRVKYKERVDEETKLPVRQNVYQLTGVITINSKSYRYLYVSSLNTSVSEVSLVETSVSETSVSEGEVSSLSKGATTKKVESTKKDKNNASGDAARSKPQDVMYNAILEIFKFSEGLNGDYRKMLENTATNKKYAPYNCNPPVTAEELLDWYAWYQFENPELHIVKAPAKLQSSIYEYRETKQPQFQLPAQPRNNANTQDRTEDLKALFADARLKFGMTK